MKTKNFNEVLKAKEAQESTRSPLQDGVIALDDTQRVKVLSPGRMVFNRFVRNKLAIAGTLILVLMFTFSFLCPLFYSYGQTEIFYKYDKLSVDYASVAERTSYTNYVVDEDAEIHYTVKNMITSYISEMEANGETEREIVDENSGNVYHLSKLGDKTYQLSGMLIINEGTLEGISNIASYNGRNKSFMYAAGYEASPELEKALSDAIASKATSVTVNDVTYFVESAGKGFYNVLDTSAAAMTLADGTAADSELIDIILHNIGGSFEYNGNKYSAVKNANGTISLQSYGAAQPLIVSSLFVFDGYAVGQQFSDEFKANALVALYGEKKFTADGVDYTVKTEDGDHVIYKGSEKFAELGKYSIRRYSGEDSLSLDFKEAASATVDSMLENKVNTGSFTFNLPRINEDGVYVYDEEGNLITEESTITVTRKEGQFVLNCDQVTYLIDIYAEPSKAHIFGTDADGMDILARMMYGGRVSLMVGFVVVIIELLIGVVLGGIAGFFGGWVDTLIMRLVDIFYCIPSMPILIILGAMFDALKMDSYTRLIWMMAVLGFLGWAGVARMVRGQILSLREQEFMTAAEATGLSTSRRIFRHLIPNVMPQLIVTATMGLGSVIITESTLSFLGLGVKHPLATWGTMINSITSSNENMIRYAYIWIPVGSLICLTVIAFNFVGDGLRDAFDPKMK